MGAWGNAPVLLDNWGVAPGTRYGIKKSVLGEPLARGFGSGQRFFAFRWCRITLLRDRESISRSEMTTIKLNYSLKTSSPAIVPLDW